MVKDAHAETERSPLLPKDQEPPLAAVGDPSGGLTADSTAAHVHDSADAESATYGSIERQTSAEDRAKQYAGLPEVRKRMKYIFPAVAVGVFLSAADQTIIASSYGKIGSDLDALNKTSWIATSYFLTLTSFQPLYGKVSDIFTRKSCVLSGYLIFGLGCLFCGLAQNINQLIAARALAGVGGGGMTTVVSIILSDIIPLKDRGAWQGYINIVYASGAAIGAPAGGFLSDSIGWRWAFLAQPPMCLIALAAVYFAYQEPKKEKADWKAKIRRVDFLGAFILVSAVFCLLFGMDRGSNVSWTAKVALVPLCLSIPLFALFLFVEMKVASEPFAPGHVILHRSLFACYMCNFFSFAGYMAAYFYIPLYYQAYDDHSATKAGFLLLPQVFASVSGSLFAGFFMRWTGKYYWLSVAAYTCQTVGMLTIFLMSGVAINSDVGICIGGALAGFGGGIGVTSVLIGTIANAKRDDQAVATACSYLFRSLGSTTGVSISSSVANQALRALLRRDLSGNDADKIADGVRQSLEYIKTLVPSVQQIVRHCYMVSTQFTFGLQVVLISGAFIAAFLIKENPLSSK